jgi:hypothetical protein
MTRTQIELARHALGLDGRRNVSYRNRFIAGVGHGDYPAWVEMVQQGDAVRHDGKRMAFGGDDMFCLTLAGARAALLPWERLCPEDFPRT